MVKVRMEDVLERDLIGYNLTYQVAPKIGTTGK